jgi:hypothetical protein
MRLLAAHAGVELFAGARFDVPGLDEATDPLLGLCPLMTCSSPVASTLLIQFLRCLLAMLILIGGRSAGFARIQRASPTNCSLACTAIWPLRRDCELREHDAGFIRTQRDRAEFKRVLTPQMSSSGSGASRRVLPPRPLTDSTQLPQPQQAHPTALPQGACASRIERCEPIIDGCSSSRAVPDQAQTGPVLVTGERHDIR